MRSVVVVRVGLVALYVAARAAVQRDCGDGEERERGHDVEQGGPAAEQAQLGDDADGNHPGDTGHDDRGVAHHVGLEFARVLPAKPKISSTVAWTTAWAAPQ